MPPLLSVAAHHSEPGDPRLLAWLMHLLDSFIGLGPLTIVIVLGLIVVSIPIGIIAVFLTQRAKYNS